jgi:hypothetical protein
VLFKVVRDVAVMRVSVKRHPEAQMAFINQAAQLVQNHLTGGQDIVFGTQLWLAIHTPNTKLFSDNGRLERTNFEAESLFAMRSIRI